MSQATPFACGKYIGLLSVDVYNWEEQSLEHDYFNACIAPEVIKAMPTYFGTVYTSENIIALSIYMIETTSSTATVIGVFISASDQHKKDRKAAQRNFQYP